MSNTAIADHTLLCDRPPAALVDHSGLVEWLSFPISGAIAGSGNTRRSGTPSYATPGLTERPPSLSTLDRPSWMHPTRRLGNLRSRMTSSFLIMSRSVISGA
jgi:hypothetical protein